MQKGPKRSPQDAHESSAFLTANYGVRLASAFASYGATGSAVVHRVRELGRDCQIASINQSATYGGDDRGITARLDRKSVV